MVIGDLLSELVQNYPNFYPDVTMNTLEDAYIHIYNHNIQDYQEQLRDSATYLITETNEQELQSLNRKS